MTARSRGYLSRHLMLWAAAVLCSGAVAACGYRAINRPKASAGGQTLCIMPFSTSGPINVSGALTEALSAALTAEGFVMEPNAQMAKNVLTGQIEVREWPSSTLQSTQLYTVDLSVSAALWGDGQEPLWQEVVSLQEDFLPTDPSLDTEPLVLERRREVALLRLTDRAAESLADSLRLADARASGH